jgi:hypothetical protein
VRTPDICKPPIGSIGSGHRSLRSRRGRPSARGMRHGCAVLTGPAKPRTPIRTTLIGFERIPVTFAGADRPHKVVNWSSNTPRGATRSGSNFLSLLFNGKSEVGSQSSPQYRGFMRVCSVSSGGDSPSGPPRKRSQRTERPKVSVWAFGYTRYLTERRRARQFGLRKCERDGRQAAPVDPR